MYNPNPMPSEELVANFMNSLGKMLASIPLPVSFTSTTTTSPPPSFPSLFPLPSASTFFGVLISAVIVIVPPSFANLIAFLSRLFQTCCIIVLSASMKIPFPLSPPFDSKFIFIFLLSSLMPSFLI
jgi:hypothetical protein